MALLSISGKTAESLPRNHNPFLDEHTLEESPNCRFVICHEPRIAGGIGGEDGGEFAMGRHFGSVSNEAYCFAIT